MTTTQLLANPLIGLAIGAFGGSAIGLVLGLLAGVIRNDKKIQASLVPAADYWEFVYGAVKNAEAAGNTGAERMAHYMDAADKFLSDAGIEGDAKRVNLERLQHDAEGALRALGFNRSAQALPAAS